MFKKLGIGCLGLVVLIVVIVVATSAGGNKTTVTSSSGSSSSTSQQPTAIPKIGDIIKSGNWQYQVSKVDRQKTVKWSDFGNTTDAKGIWEIVQIKVTNIGKESFPINAWDFEVKDADGITYKDDTSTMYSKFLKLSAIGDTYPPNVPAEIAVLFDVNPAAKGLQLNLVQAKTAVDLGQ